MRLRTLAGSYAGQVRDYSYAAGCAALQTGTAARLDETPPRPRVVPITQPTSSASPWKRRHR